MATDLTKNVALNKVYPGNFDQPFPGLEHFVSARGRRFDTSQEPNHVSGGSGVGNLASATTYSVMTLPEGAIPIGFVLDVKTAEGASCTLTVGTDSDPDYYVTDFDANSATTQVRLRGGTTNFAMAATDRLDADAHISIAVSAACDAAIFDLIVLFVGTEALEDSSTDT